MVMYRSILLVGLLVWLILTGISGTNGGATLRFQADEWQTECDVAHETADRDCSIIGVFRNTLPDGTKGSFSLLIDITNARVVIVGQPNPVKATIQVDKNPQLTCTANPHCIFSTEDSAAITGELAAGRLVLIDIFAPKHTFRASLSTKGYQVSIVKISAQDIR
jgi:hypothetical protein